MNHGRITISPPHLSDRYIVLCSGHPDFRVEHCSPLDAWVAAEDHRRSPAAVLAGK